MARAHGDAAGGGAVSARAVVSSSGLYGVASPWS